MSLLLQLVQANVDEFTPCYEEWWNLCPNRISTETKACTIWHLKLLLVKQMKTSSTMPIFNFKSTCHAEMIGDIMYLQQALKQPDAKEFVQAIIKEVNGHVVSNNWMLQNQSNVPENVQIVPSVWSLQCKRDLATNEVKSHKARLNLHGGKQVCRMNYFETYAPVVTWFAIRLMIIFGIIFCWALQQVDFIMAYP